MAQHGAHPQWSRPIPPPPNRPPGTHGRLRRPHWRVLTWVILAFNALMLVCVVVGVNAASDGGETCADDACAAGNDLGTLIGTGMLIFVWMAGAVILGVIWLVTNQHRERDRRDRRW
ncbi:hypothetical protein ACFYO9_00265 [Streptomyces sp. NPDC005863]|uniref:hypothetical protein n=1 Tax=Streptomyces sp. NPDC005863 TaxID=3364735 RepID=UPI0036AE04CB